MRTINLTQGQVALVDDEDYETLSQHRWYAGRGLSRAEGRQYVVLRRTPTSSKRKTVLMHREILQAAPGTQVDHIDGNPLNNQRSNLRLCTNAENQRNTRMRRNNRSGYKGVSWRKDAKKWRARIRLGEAEHHLGNFGDKEEAARAYDAAAKELYGEFAYLNFPVTTAVGRPGATHTLSLRTKWSRR